jgi:predicted AAA+ superfamily ATPase
VLHAPRQSGKTTLLPALAARLNAESCYRALYVNVESAQTAREDVQRGMRAILSELAASAENQLGDTWMEENRERVLASTGEDAALARLLSDWSKINPKPIVLFIDEIDSLVGDTLFRSENFLPIISPSVRYTRSGCSPIY